MANSRNVSIDELGEAIEQQLTLYHEEVTKAIDEAGAESMRDLVKRTRATAPEGHRGTFKRKITSTVEKNKNGSTYIWHVKAPEHRLTHLLVHGHATKDGGRTRANPFLTNALDTVLLDYERKVEEALKNGK